MTTPNDPTRIPADVLAVLTSPTAKVQPDEELALRRLLTLAEGDSGQCRRAADFLLAWWNPETCGRFDFTDAWGFDRAVADDVSTVFAMIVRVGQWPDRAVPHLRPAFEALVREWRPALFNQD